MIALLLQGLALGWVAGLQPGPMQTYIITESTMHGWRAGARVGLAPLASDGPIILAVLLLLRLFGEQLPNWLLAAISLIGAGVLLWLAWGLLGRFRTADALVDDDAIAPDTPTHFGKAVLINLTNPNPYLFWSTIGLSRLYDGWAQSPAHIAAFLLGMYGMMISVHTGYALLGSQLRRLPQAAVRWIWALGAGVMLLLALLVALNGLLYLGLFGNT